MSQKVLYLDLSGGLTKSALENTLQKIDLPTQILCSPVPLHSTATLSISSLEKLSIKAGKANVTQDGVDALVKLSPQFVQLPEMKVLSVQEGKGEGAFIRAILGTYLPSQVGIEESLFVLEANLDDLSPQLVSVFSQQAFQEGALDVWSQPIFMKKGRPGLLLGVLCRSENKETLIQTFFEETTTLGVRIYPTLRRALVRKYVPVKTKFGAISIKLGLWKEKLLNAHPEFEDCQRCAKSSGVPVKQVIIEALSVFWAENQIEKEE